MATKKQPAKRAVTRPHGPQPSGAEADGDAFLLNENGTVRCRWRGHNVLLWTPTVGEYEKIALQYEETRAWYSEDGRKGSEAFSTAAPNAHIWVGILDVLGDNDEPVVASDLATWMLSADALERLIRHWRVNPLARGESQDLLSQVTQNVIAAFTESATTPPSSSPEAPSQESAEN